MNVGENGKIVNIICTHRAVVFVTINISMVNVLPNGKLFINKSLKVNRSKTSKTFGINVTSNLQELGEMFSESVNMPVLELEGYKI